MLAAGQFLIVPWSRKIRLYVTLPASPKTSKHWHKIPVGGCENRRKWCETELLSVPNYNVLSAHIGILATCSPSNVWGNFTDFPFCRHQCKFQPQQLVWLKPFWYPMVAKWKGEHLCSNSGKLGVSQACITCIGLPVSTNLFLKIEARHLEGSWEKLNVSSICLSSWKKILLFPLEKHNFSPSEGGTFLLLPLEETAALS